MWTAAYSETSDSCERNFSDISVILITGPFLSFFFREGALERPDLETAVLHLACTALTTVAEGMSILWEEEMVGCEGNLWLSSPGIGGLGISRQRPILGCPSQLWAALLCDSG